jgi:antitoxin HicB
MKNSTLAYPAIFTAEAKGGFSVSFPDFSEAHSQGNDVEDAFRMAVDCLHTAIEWRLERKADIPEPSRLQKGQHLIPVSLDLAPKLALAHLMRERKISNVNLARNLKVSELVVRRMLDPKHKSKPDQYTRAFAALGCAAQLQVVEMHKQ